MNKKIIAYLLSLKAVIAWPFVCSCASRLFALRICPSLDEIKEGYQVKNGRILSVDITNNDVGPERDGKFYTQKFATAVGDCRNRFTFNIIVGLLKKYGLVTVIYGAGHSVILRQSFDSALGEPKLLRLKDLEHKD